MLYDRVQNWVGDGTAIHTIVRDYVQPATGCSILDIGAGTGTIAEHLTDVSYTAVEPNLAYVRQFNARNARSQADARAIAGDVSVVAGLDQQFDRVLILSVLHHVDDATASRLLAAAASVLRPDGRVVCLDPCLYPGQNVIAGFLARLDRGRMVRSPGEYESLVREHFETVRVSLRNDLVRIPYSHTVIVAKDPLIRKPDVVPSGWSG